ncbi:hypothetical protein C8Q76DRAFT_625333, partial [Earliella scabrosa]
HSDILIRDWQDKCCKRAVRALIYPVAGGTPRVVSLPLHKRFDFEDDVPRYTEDLDVKRWFPRGVEYTRLDTVPGLGDQLFTNFTVLRSSTRYTVAFNRCVDDLGYGNYFGNVILVRHGRRCTGALTNASTRDRVITDMLVKR